MKKISNEMNTKQNNHLSLVKKSQKEVVLQQSILIGILISNGYSVEVLMPRMVPIGYKQFMISSIKLNSESVGIVESVNTIVDQKYQEELEEIQLSMKQNENETAKYTKEVNNLGERKKWNRNALITNGMIELIKQMGYEVKERKIKKSSKRMELKRISLISKNGNEWIDDDFIESIGEEVYKYLVNQLNINYHGMEIKPFDSVILNLMTENDHSYLVVPSESIVFASGVKYL